MKRSEMIEILRDLIENTIEGYDAGISDSGVDYILQEIEMLGLRPYRVLDCGCCTDSSWEPENE